MYDAGELDEFDLSMDLIDRIRGITKRKGRLDAIQNVLRDTSIGEIVKEQVRGFFWVDHPEYVDPWGKKDMFFSSKFDCMKNNGARRNYANAILKNQTTSDENKMAVKKIMVARPWLFDDSDKRY
jgi:hypothetical protein